MKIAVIPARGGSKRIPRKNIKPFLGKPMIAWSIEAALACGLFDSVIVSTDDDEIAGISREHGATTPFVRPDALSDDSAGTMPVMAHAAQYLLDEGLQPSAICCIYATTPFIRLSDINQAWQEFDSSDWEYVFTATEFAAPIFRSFKKHVSGGLEMLFPEYFNSRSQDLPVVLHDAGQFYWGQVSAWLQEKPVFDRNSKPLIIPSWRVQDIDTLEDWRRAEIIAPMVMAQGE